MDDLNTVLAFASIDVLEDISYRIFLNFKIYLNVKNILIILFCLFSISCSSQINIPPSFGVRSSFFFTENLGWTTDTWDCENKFDCKFYIQTYKGNDFESVSIRNFDLSEQEFTKLKVFISEKYSVYGISKSKPIDSPDSEYVMDAFDVDISICNLYELQVFLQKWIDSRKL